MIFKKLLFWESDSRSVDQENGASAGLLPGLRVYKKPAFAYLKPHESSPSLHEASFNIWFQFNSGCSKKALTFSRLTKIVFTSSALRALVVYMQYQTDYSSIIIIIIIIIFIYCNWVVNRWQWLFYMYTKYEIGY